jgi:hypothetical protein
LLIYDGSGNQAIFWFNALTQQVGTVATGGTGWTAVSAAISDEGGGWFRLQALATISGNTYFQINACDGNTSYNYTTVAGKTLTIAFPQSENVSGQADKTAGEYVSVGVLSAPFHGAGVDGCKYFLTNKDGSAISSSVLLGYNPEPSRVNNCLYGRDLRGMTAPASYSTLFWTNTARAGAAELITNGTFDTVTTGWSAGGGATLSVDAGTLRITTPGGANAGAGQAISCDIGKTYAVSFDAIYSATTIYLSIGTSLNGSQLGYLSVTSTRTRTISFVATSTTIYVFFYILPAVPAVLVLNGP